MARTPRSLTCVLGLVLLASLLPSQQTSAAPGGDGATWNTVTIDLPNGGIGYDPVRDQVLVSIPSSHAALGNRLVELDPQTGALGRSVVVGANPTQVEVADDGSRAYVALRGTSRVAEVDLATFTITRHITLGGIGLTGWMFAHDLDVQPGNPGVLAVVLSDESDRVLGVAVFDEGVQRPTTTVNFYSPSQIEWGDDPSTIYGISSSKLLGMTYHVAVDASGASLTQLDYQNFERYGDIEFADGRLHATTGGIMNVTTMTMVANYGAAGAIEVDEDQLATFILDEGVLSRFHARTRALEWSRAVPDINARDLVDAGSALVAAGPASIQLMGPGVSGSGFVLPPAPTSILQMGALHTVPTASTAIVGSLTGDRVFAVVDREDTPHDGELMEIDAATGDILRTLDVGYGPFRIARSDDGNTLLIGHSDAHWVTEVDTTTFEVTTRTLLEHGHRALDIEAVPGHPSAFAVVVSPVSQSSSRVMMIEGGSVLPAQLPSVAYSSTIELAGNPLRLYRWKSNPWTHLLTAAEVTDAGLTMLWERPSWATSQLDASDGNRLYSHGGHVLDPREPLLVGALRSGEIPVPDPARGRTLTISAQRITEVDHDDLQTIAITPVDWPYVRDAALVGAQLAVATDDGLILLPLGPETLAPPGPPGDPSVVAGDRSLHVAWSPPASDGGSPITRFEVRAEPGGATCATTALECTLVGLTNGMPTTVTLRTVTAIGSSTTVSDGPHTPTSCDGPGNGPFADVPAEHRFCADIEWAVARALVAGFGDGTFRPTAPLSRQAIASMLYRRIGSPQIVHPVFPTFMDVDLDHPFTSAIEWAVLEQLVSGYPDGTFQPTSRVTRQSLASMLHRAAGSPSFTPPASPTFSDIPVGHPFRLEIEWMVAEGIAAGYADGRFRPGEGVSRQAAVTFVHRFDLTSAP